MANSLTSSNWASLQGDLLCLILDKLVFHSDYVRFGAVCKSWNSIALSCKENRIRKSNHQLPWLLIGHRDKSKRRIISLYNSNSAKICNFKLRIPYNLGEYYGSSHGWLFFMKTQKTGLLFFKKTQKSSLIVLNPLSGTIFRLPPFDNSKINVDNDSIKIARLSRDPSFGSFEVFVIFLFSNMCAHLKFGHTYWTYVPNYKDLINDVTFYQDRIFGVTKKGRIVSIDIIIEEIDDIDSSKESIRNIKIREIAPILKVIPLQCLEGYFVEAINGDLLVVYRYYDFELGDSMIYIIYKLIESNGELERIPVVNLGAECLFLGKSNCSVSISASNYPGYKPNTIYCLVEEVRIEVCNLDEGTIAPSFFPVYLGYRYFTAWMAPTIKL